MKKILFLLLGICILVTASLVSKNDFLGARKYYYYSPCTAPLPFTIGSIDAKFGLSRMEVLKTTILAAEIWNQAMGKPIFAYDPGAVLSIHMIYDKRQSLTTEVTQQKSTLSNGKIALNSDYERYVKKLADYKTRTKAFTNQVDYWNAKGGAPKDEYDKLKKEQQSLTAESELLNATAEQLNLSTDAYNEQVGALKQKIGSLNNMLAIKPEEGVYDPNTNRIEVYFHNNRDELIRTLAHELGHARGLDHSNDPKAIMYPTTTEFTSPVNSELTALAEICRTRPFYEIVLMRIQKFITDIKSNNS